jgi:hypothetical protein
MAENEDQSRSEDPEIRRKRAARFADEFIDRHRSLYEKLARE